MNRIKVKVIGIKWILSWTGILKDPEITSCDDKIWGMEGYCKQVESPQWI